jgi:hypothetical protein
MWAWLMLASPHSLGYGCAMTMGISLMWSVRLLILAMVVVAEPIHRCWEADDSMGVCSSILKNKGGSPRIPLKSRQKIYLMLVFIDLAGVSGSGRLCW